MTAKPRKRKGGVLYLRNVPPAVRTTFRRACLLRGRNMNAVIVEFMTKYCEGADSVVPPRNPPKKEKP